MSVLQWEIERTRWGKLRAAADPARIPGALIALATATSEASAMNAYWQIDNVAVVQARVFEVAEYVIFPLLLILRGSPSPWTVRCALDLLVQVTSGWPDPSEVGINDGLLERIRDRAREGLAIVYSLLRSEDVYARDHAIEVLDSIETDRKRLIFILGKLATVETDPNVRELAARIINHDVGEDILLIET